MIAERVAALIRERHAVVSKPSGFRASEVGVLCSRYQYHARVDWDKRPAPDERLAHVFHLGQELEEYVLSLVREAGISVVKAQVAGTDEDLDLVGHVDGFAVLGGREVPLEVKSVSEHLWVAIRSWADMASEARPYMMRWALQLPLYMYLHGHEEGLYLLLNKTTGEVKELRVTIEEAWPLLERANEVLVEARTAVASMTPPPDPRPWAPSFCGGCWVRQVGLCPGVRTAPPAGVDLSAVEEAAAVMAETREAHQRYEAAHKALVAALTAVDLAPGQRLELQAGQAVVRVTAYETTQYHVPKEVKEQYAVKAKQRRVEVISTQGGGA